MAPKNIYAILHAALDAAAPDGESWTAGLNAFEKTPDRGFGTVKKAAHNALDAAAPDKERWNAGYQVLKEGGLVSSRDWPKPSGIVRGAILGLLASLVVAIIVTLWIPILNSVLGLLLLLLVLGGALLGYNRATKPKELASSVH